MKKSEIFQKIYKNIKRNKLGKKKKIVISLPNHLLNNNKQTYLVQQSAKNRQQKGFNEFSKKRFNKNLKKIKSEDLLFKDIKNLALSKYKKIKFKKTGQKFITQNKIKQKKLKNNILYLDKFKSQKKNILKMIQKGSPNKLKFNKNQKTKLKTFHRYHKSDETFQIKKFSQKNNKIPLLQLTKIKKINKIEIQRLSLTRNLINLKLKRNLTDRKDLLFQPNFLQTQKNKIKKQKLLINQNIIKSTSNNNKVSKLIPLLKSTFKSQYKLQEIIGKGAYANVKMVKERKTNNLFAVKIYLKKQIKNKVQKQSIQNEIEILKKVNHENILKYEKLFKNKQKIYIITEYISRVSLEDYLNIQDKKRLEEHHARTLFIQLSKSINYLHKLNIVHRDLKLQNILLKNSFNLKVIDFGFSLDLNKTQKVNFCGTPSYMSPEIIQKIVHNFKSSDVWALGVLLYKKLTGKFPFQATNQEDLFRKIINCQISFPKYISYQAKNLLIQIFNPDYKKRIKIKQIIKHQWLQQDNSKNSKTTSCEQINYQIIQLFSIGNLLFLFLQQFENIVLIFFYLLFKQLFVKRVFWVF